jgi:hypothetical protein
MTMAVQIMWDNPEKTIVRYNFEGRWTWDEFYPVYKEALAMELSVPHRVDVIVDLQNARLFPDNLLTHMKGISDKQPPNIGVSVLVTKHRFVHSMYNIGIKFYGKIKHYFRLAETLEDAYKMIEEERQQAG